MLIHPELMMSIAGDRHRELVAEADRWRLLSGARAARAARKARGADGTARAAGKAREAGTARGTGTAQGATSTVARGRPAGTLGPCEPSAAVPAR